MDNKIFEMETARIGLRKWQGTDAEALYRHASHPDVGPRAGWRPHSDIEESRTIINTVFNTPTTWAIVLKETGEPIGAIGYGESCEHDGIPALPGEPVVGYWVAQPYWGMGICTEALQLMVDYCVNVMHFDNIYADHFTGNPASGRIMEKCGFIDTGRLNRCSQLLGGDSQMVRVYRYSPEEQQAGGNMASKHTNS